MPDLFAFLRSRRHKNSKFWFYVRNLWYYLLPRPLIRRRLGAQLAKAGRFDPEYIAMRVNYYNRLASGTDAGWWRNLPPDLMADRIERVAERTERVGDFHFEKQWKPSTLFFDFYAQMRYFPAAGHFTFLPYDNPGVPPVPALVKSRPLVRPELGVEDNSRAVVHKLDALRHFTFVKDRRSFASKENRLVGRCAVYQEHRIRFFEKYFGHPLCDLGQINRHKTRHPEWIAPKMPLDDHLRYKFILCLEGNDVASNLKWVMSSNSLAVMPRPRCETWFMEGTLQPNVHYVTIKEDYSDLEERLEYYIGHPDEAQEIIENAHRFIAPFRNAAREKLIGLLVLQKYFMNTGQAEIFS